ncbi:MAG: AAA family ATPase [Patescibacteria group bacterium]|nr:AAA family ATPase [Patescibacteria group bacterium]
MKISKIITENYRSIQKTEILPNNFSVFVGQNNHGKTNFFESIEWFYTAKSSKADEHFNKDETNKISVEIFFEDVVESDIEKLTTDANKTKIKTMLGEHKNFSVLKTSTDHKRKYFVNDEDKGNPSGLDTAINEFLPKLEYVNTKICLDDVSKYKDKNPIGTMLSGVLTAIIENSQDYIDFKAQFSKLFDSDSSEVRQELDKLGTKVEIYLQKQFPDGTKVKFGVNPPNFNDLLKSFDTTVDDGIETKAEDKGDGMQRAIMLSIIQAFADYRKEKSGGGTFLFLIDEAELHLHPSAQRALKKALIDICTTDQVFINTHSSVLVVEDNKCQKIFKVEKTNKITDITEVGEAEKIDVIFDLLGGSPSDLFLPRNFLIVEGRSEFEFINCIIKRFYISKYKGIKIIFAGGDIDEQEPSLLAVHKLFVPLAGSDNPIYKDKAVVLIDKPNSKQQTKYDQFKAGYPYLFENKQVFELDVETLEQYYPNGYKKAKNEIDANKKVEYTKEVATNITKEQFESEMKIIFDALEAVNTKGFNPN